jgi:pilus assembly protein FimV
VGDLRRLVELKEDQLADLQNQLAASTEEPASPQEAPAAAAPVTETPKPQPRPAPEPEPGQPASPSPASFLDQVNAMLPVPLWSIGGGLLALLVGVAGLRWSRRRKEAAGEGAATADLVGDETVLGDDALAEHPADAGGEGTEVTEVSPEDAAAAAGESTQVASGHGGTPTADEDEDPLAEVNVYLAYERFDQAEQLVRDAVERYPERHDYRLKLLEVFYASKNAASFQAAAHQLREVAGGDEAMMQQAREWWADLGTGSDLFGENGATGPEARTVGTEADEVLSLAGAAGVTDEETGVDFDLGFGGTETQEASSGIDFDLGDFADEERAEEAGAASVGGTSLDFDLGELGETSAPAGEAAAAGSASDTGVDFDLSGLDAGTEEDLSQGPSELEKDEAGRDTGLDFDLTDTMTLPPEDLERTRGTGADTGAPAAGEDTGLDFDLGDTTVFARDDEIPPTLPGGDSAMDAELGEAAAEAAEKRQPADADAEGADSVLDLDLGEGDEELVGGDSSFDFELDDTIPVGEKDAGAGGESLDVGGDSSFDFEIDDTSPLDEGSARAGGGAPDAGAASGSGATPESDGDAAGGKALADAAESGLDFDLGDAAPEGAGSSGTGESLGLDLDLGESGPLGGGDAALSAPPGGRTFDADSTISLADAGVAAGGGVDAAAVTVDGGAATESPQDDLQGAVTEVGDDLGLDLSLDTVDTIEDAATGQDGSASESGIEVEFQEIFEAEGASGGGSSVDFDLGAGLDEVGGDGEEDRAVLLGPNAPGEVDENQTKLDLAQAYIDMGDVEGARNLLGEVASGGSEEQQGQAREMLGKLS